MLWVKNIQQENKLAVRSKMRGKYPKMREREAAAGDDR